MPSASRSASLRRMLFGDVPHIRTVGFVTARPGNDRLQEYLRCSNLGPVLVKSEFGDASLVPNVHREELVNICGKFDRQAVVWGQKEADAFQFEYIEGSCSIGQPFTADFRIPFFDDPLAELVFNGKVNELTYYSDRLPDTLVVRELVEDIQKHSDAVFAGEYAACRGKYYWHHRGIVRECLWKLNRL